MKVKNLFRKANFSGLLLTEELYQSKLVHKAKIEINEAGSTASAATVMRVRYFGAIQM